ncbi:hypothetical protein BA768_17105 [Chryseobacterium sp. CBo1]|uniref:hypothetical protein n=1 Tax=unclassified Chryseobacterium TaxID=2593645 RepID=UPI0008104752|nr:MULTISPECIES: hypothetical protein [unclassified Chryseobacterium]OCK51276.1 hypothetical protein BA768_17105 [Chryseobacterium sp. CBo1]
MYKVLSRGIDQAIANGLTKNDSVYGVLATDYDAWMKVANDKTYGKLLRAKYNLLINTGNVLRLQKGFTSTSRENLNGLSSTVKKTPEK